MSCEFLLQARQGRRSRSHEDDATCVNKIRILKDAKKEVITRLTISSEGDIYFLKVKKESDTNLKYSLRMIQGKREKVLLAERSDVISDLAQVWIDGRERLLLCYNRNLVLMDSKLKKIERTVIEMNEAFTMCDKSRQSLLIVKANPMKQGSYEVQDILITGRDWSCIHRTTIDLDWRDMDDVSSNGELVTMCSYNDEQVATIHLTSGKLWWNIRLEDAFSVCFDPHGMIYVACSGIDKIEKLAPTDGKEISSLHLVPRAAYPTYVHFHNEKLYVNHWDAEAYKSNKQVDWVMSQYQLPNKQ